MKRNKLNLTAGILLVITAALSIVSEIVYIVNFIRLISLYRSVGYTNFTLLILFYAYMFVLYLAQAIIYMIFGVKLIKKSNLPNAYAESKTIIIVSLVLTSCSFAFDFQRILTMLYAACIVLLICCLCSGARLDSDNLAYLSKEAGVNSPSQVQPQPVQEVKQEIIPEKSNNEMMAEKIIAIKKLKDDGIISQSEFDNMLSSFVPTQSNKASKPTKIATSSKSTKNPTKRTRSTKKIETDNPKKDDKE